MSFAVLDLTTRPRVSRFSTLPTMDGFEVIDEDGRAVACRSTNQSANGVAQMLNEAATAGSRPLAMALSRLR